MSKEDLITALEQADGPSRELDDEIANLMLSQSQRIRLEGMADDGWVMVFRYPDGSEGTSLSYTASVDAALTLVPASHEWRCGNDAERNKGWACVDSVVWDEAFEEHEVRAEASTPTIALCIAALRARA